MVIFVAVAPKQRSPKLSVSWLTLYGLVYWLPVSAGNFWRALQRHFSVDFQNRDVVGKILSCSKRASFTFVNRTRNGRAASPRSILTHWFRDWLKTEAALQRQRPLCIVRGRSAASEVARQSQRPIYSVRGTAASFFSRFSKPRWKDLFLLETSMFCFCESNKKRTNTGRSKFADTSILLLIEDWARSKVQASYRLSKVRETRAA